MPWPRWMRAIQNACRGPGLVPWETGNPGRPRALGLGIEVSIKALSQGTQKRCGNSVLVWGEVVGTPGRTGSRKVGDPSEEMAGVKIGHKSNVDSLESCVRMTEWRWLAEWGGRDGVLQPEHRTAAW